MASLGRHGSDEQGRWFAVSLSPFAYGSPSDQRPVGEWLSEGIKLKPYSQLCDL